MAPLRKTTKPYPQRTHVMIAAALVVAVNIVAGLYFVHGILNLRVTDGEIINVAGRQRMLSQRLLAYAYIVSADPDDASAGAELSAVAAKWKHAHRTLLDAGDDPSPGGKPKPWHGHLQSLSPNIESTITLLPALRNGEALALKRLSGEIESFLPEMDAVVNEMSTLLTDELAWMQRVSIVVTGMMLVILVALINGYLLPAHRQREALVEKVVAQRDLLERRYEQLAQANEGLNQFMHVASHDMKTPLRSIGSFAGLIQRRYGYQLGAEATEYFGFIKDCASSMNRVLDDLVAYNSAGFVRERTEVDLDAVLREVRTNLSADLMESSTTIEFGVLGKASASHVVAVQVLQNLVRNAIVHREYDRPCVVRIRRDGHQLHVADNGVGLSEAYRDKVFEPFQRVGDLTRPGSGIGLAICRKLLGSIGGGIDYRGEVGVGTTFVVTFAVARGAEVKAGARVAFVGAELA